MRGAALRPIAIAAGGTGGHLFPAEALAVALAARGAVVDLDRVPLKYEGLSYTEIWISEAQERMVLAVPAEQLAALEALCAAEEVEATCIGTITDSGRLVEIKTARSADGWGEAGTDEVPQEYLIQVQHYLAVTALPVADVAVLFGGQEFRLGQGFAPGKGHSALRALEKRRVLGDFSHDLGHGTDVTHGFLRQGRADLGAGPAGRAGLLVAYDAVRPGQKGAARTGRQALAATHAALRHRQDLRPRPHALGVVAPLAAQGTALEKDRHA